MAADYFKTYCIVSQEMMEMCTLDCVPLSFASAMFVKHGQNQWHTPNHEWQSPARIKSFCLPDCRQWIRGQFGSHCPNRFRSMNHESTEGGRPGEPSDWKDGRRFICRNVDD